MLRKGGHLAISSHIDDVLSVRLKQRPFHHSTGHKLENDI